MARAKRKSTVLETARKRLSGLKAITPAPDFGPNLKIPDYEQQINTLSEKLDHYNTMTATLDDLQNELEALEAELRITSTRILSAAEAAYGPDSSQYELAGGTPTSERKRSTKKSGNGGSSTP